MKRALISMLYLLTFLTTCFSQTATLSKKMATYRNFCLKVREGVELKNVQTLKECIAEWTGDINTTYIRMIRSELPTLTDSP